MSNRRAVFNLLILQRGCLVQFQPDHELPSFRLDHELPATPTGSRAASNSDWIMSCFRLDHELPATPTGTRAASHSDWITSCQPRQLNHELPAIPTASGSRDSRTSGASHRVDRVAVLITQRSARRRTAAALTIRSRLAPSIATSTHACFFSAGWCPTRHGCPLARNVLRICD